MSVEVGQSLPNLKITVGNDGRSARDEEEKNEEINKDASDKDELRNVPVVRKLISPLESFRVYENKGGAFITGLDLSSEVVAKKLADRAARFNLEGRPQNAITQIEIDALYKSLDIDPKHGKCKNIRLDALHVRGVEEMSTAEVIDYFQEYGPSSVEWINDSCCNVVWLDTAGAARALLGLSKVLVVRKKNATHQPDVKQDTQNIPSEVENVLMIEESNKADAEEVIFMSDISSDDDDEEDKLVAFKHEKSGNQTDFKEDEPMEVTDTCELPKNNATKCEDDFPVDVPVPPGHWRLGFSHAKAKAILLRFATKDDRKLPGAERRSQYYQKYGNPNYGGLRGLISNTKKRKFNITKQRKVVEQLSMKGNTSTSKATIIEPNRKQLRMRMHADDEEERMRLKNAKKLRTVESVSSRRNVHDRLGDFMPRRRSYEDDGWNDRNNDGLLYNVKSTILKPTSSKEKPSRFNVWTELAESMAEESEISRTNNQSSPPHEQRHFQDLRSKLHSTARSKTSHVDKSSGDLRSKLEKLRKNVKAEHRSPLLIELDNETDSDR